MKKIVALSVVVVLVALLTGCGLAGCYKAPLSPPMGLAYADVKAPANVELSEASLGTKEGTAMSKNYLGLVALGDASVKAAAQSAGITEVTHVDYHIKNILGIYSEFTVIVYGN
ncbi:hypothetical protein HQ520_14940 [bacterium]|nr:hypothetical protein [bacterium]